ncbi:dynamin family protein [Kutzneria kofuensis]|uniref:Ethanolamine utilization protein EutP (Predicted NTPase) n=1 Tax=Kutzneria kofuensis TaxID=103725 RepID=A0A7W9KD69_9PSEU|nr:dynamin family protein [Kutzneria kofuensis]MBB5890337.1 ethanolamine utilization protein EutP (predicted NTPase) [Kutzneria kofuensis]
MTALDVIDEALRQPAIGRRRDLTSRLSRLRVRLADPAIRVVVVGSLKQGKSHLVNALLGASVCPVHDDVASAAPAVIRYAEQAWAAVVRPGQQRLEPVEVDRVAQEISGGQLVRAEIGVNRAVLSGGLVIVDTPGVDGLRSEHTSRTLAELAEADAVLAVTDALTELSPAELQFLRFATTICPNVLGVLTKTDLSPRWRAHLERNRMLIAQAGLAIPLVAVSSVLRERALRTGSQEVNAESGFPALVGYLENTVKAQAGMLARRSASEAILAVTEQVSLGLRAELSTQDPTSLAGLEDAQRAAELLRRQSSRWQNMLMDGMADLMSDVDHDLRERTRVILRHTDQAFDKADPAKTWDQFCDWLADKLTDAVLRNYDWTVERTHWLAQRIAEQFDEESRGTLPDLGLRDPARVLERMGGLITPDLAPPGVANKVITGLRGSYSGMLMFGLLTSLMGMPLVNFVSVGAGAVMGAKTLKEERDAQLKRRQAVAKTAVQRHVDELVFQVGKHSRDALRHVQRRLREHFTEQAEQLQDELTESIRRARELANADLVARNQRNQSISEEINTLVALRQRAQALALTS